MCSKTQTEAGYNYLDSYISRHKTLGMDRSSLKYPVMCSNTQAQSGNTYSNSYIISHRYLGWTGYSKILQKDSGVFLPRNSSYEYIDSYISNYKKIGISGVFPEYPAYLYPFRLWVFKMGYNVMNTM